jgi:8-oxo-dGTP pyrophosphatase MutT (NUDIX family)
MGANVFELGVAGLRGRRAVVVTERLDAPVARVRCVLRCGQRYLLAQHNSRRRANTWGLPGGRLKSREEPRAALRRELVEELGLRVKALFEIGDWLHRGENHRVFGCDVARITESFAPEEILAIDWFDYAQVSELAAIGRLRTGFELDAIAAFGLRFPRTARSSSVAYGDGAAERTRRQRRSR